MIRRFLAVLFAALFSHTAMPHTMVYHQDAAAALAACQADGAVGSQGCSPSGYAVTRWCPTYGGCGALMTTGGLLGCAVIEQTSKAPAPGGQCPYTVQTEYHYHAYPQIGCAPGKIFRGPTGADCVTPEQASVMDASQKQLAGGPSFAATSCAAPKAGSGASGAIADSSLVGNPCDASTGNKLHTETDFAGGFGVPEFSRTYNSFANRDIGLGQGWSHTYGKRVILLSASSLQYVTANGSVAVFTKAGSTWTGDADLKTTLTVTAGYSTFTHNDGSIEVFDPKGLPVSDTDPAGRVTKYTFTADGYLTGVTGPFGHKLLFNWSNFYSIGTVTFPDGTWLKFAKDAKANLSTATRSDSVVPAGVVTKYVYEDAVNPHALTGIVDANNVRFSTYAYSPTSGRAISTEHAGGVGRFALAYSGNQTVITDAAGNTQTLTLSSNLGINRLVSRTDSSDGKSRLQTFDADNNLLSRTDEEGRITNFTWDVQHRMLSMVEAATTAEERTTTYAYASPNLDQPTTISEPGRTTTITYNGASLPTEISINDGSSTRVTTFTYTAMGQVATMDGPRTDIADTTQFTYWDCTTGVQCGQLKTVTNAVGHVTTFDQYDANGRLLKKTDANGLATNYAYNAAGNITSVTETPLGGTARTSSLTYDKAQQILTATMPDGVVLTYAYNAAHQLTSVTNNLGGKVAYGYDLRGNRNQTLVKDSSGTIQRQVDVVFNARNFVATVNAAGSITQIVTDAVGNPTTLTDPNGHASTNTVDALNRITRNVDRLFGITDTTYDAQGHIAGVAAPNGAATTYTANGFGDQTGESSPDRGAVSQAFDAAGNVLTRTDARGITASFTYDALNRVSTISYPDSAENVALTWDSCANGKGRLCSVADPSGTRAYAYDGFGRLASVVWTAGGQTFTTSYTWTAGDKLATVTYPSGRTVSFTRDALARVASIATGGQSIVSGRTYRVDGILTGQTYGNGLVDARTYDTQGRLTTWNTGVDSRAYTYDANGNITAIAGSAFGYDWLDRLISAPALTFAYDSNSNRTADAAGSYAYAPNSNRLIATPTAAVNMDAAGNTTAIGSQSYAFNQAGRMASASVGGVSVGQYLYAFDGQRVSKSTAGGTTLFHFGIDGTLLAETDAGGTTLKEYVWDDDGRPLAQIAGSVITFLHPDHLGSPRIGTDSGRNITWQWFERPFGTGPPVGSVTVNLRYPGQYFDAESGLHQNWHRTFAPLLGRYLESDPIGLAAGTNTFGYVGGNPLSYADPDGRNPLVPLIELGLLAYTVANEDVPIIGSGLAKAGNVAFKEVSAAGKFCFANTASAKRGVVEFQGLEVRAVRPLAHMDEQTLRAMQQYGFAAKDAKGNMLVLHHHRQNPAGPIVEIPAANHSIGNVRQHPFGSTKGAGLKVEERALFNQWRSDYWRWRATEELKGR